MSPALDFEDAHPTIEQNTAVMYKQRSFAMTMIALISGNTVTVTAGCLFSESNRVLDGKFAVFLPQRAEDAINLAVS
jgi:hypothetical protein